MKELIINAPQFNCSSIKQGEAIVLTKSGTPTYSEFYKSKDYKTLSDITTVLVHEVTKLTLTVMDCNGYVISIPVSAITDKELLVDFLVTEKQE